VKYPVPPPGREAIIILGPRDAHVRVKVLGEVTQRALSAVNERGRVDIGNQEHRPVLRLVLVQVPGEDKPRQVAVERFVEACTDYRL
jgi:hypothetical protein